MDDVKILTRKRGAIKHKLTNFVTYFNPVWEKFTNKDVIDEQVLFELAIRVNNFQLILQEFDEIHVAITCVCDEECLDQHYTYRDEFFNVYMSNLANANAVLKYYNASENSGANPVRSSSVSDNGDLAGNVDGIKLPTINLMKFNGTFTQWLEFKDTFESIIHKNQKIQTIQKFHYLKSALEGEAKKVIEGIECCNSNYQLAWDLINERYNNTKLLKHNHIKSVMDLKMVNNDTPGGIRYIQDNMSKHVRALKNLKVPVDHWDDILIYITLSKLNISTQEEWEKQKGGSEDATLSDLIAFLKARAEFLERVESKTTKPKQTHFIKNRNVSLAGSINKKYICNFCNKNHLIYNCEEFIKLTVNEKIGKAKELKLCENCLCTGHSANVCKSNHNCKNCSGKHNTLLHQENSTNEKNNQVALTSQNCGYSALLATAVVYIKDKYHNLHSCRILLDSGSQLNFITDQFVSKLGLHTIQANISVVGINKIESKLEKKCKITLKSRFTSYETNLNCFVMSRITENLPSRLIDISKWNIPTNLQLADDKFYVPDSVDLLIGSDTFWNLLLKESISIGKYMPTIQHTVLGWVVSGQLTIAKNLLLNKGARLCNFATSNINDLDELNNNLKSFWEIEAISQNENSDLTNEDQECENHFKNHVKRTNDGRFVVSIPLKYNPDLLGDSKQTAIKRFLNLEKMFQKNENLKLSYQTFMEEYINLGHMSESNFDNSSSVNYFLPHHAVERPESLTSKIRVVFDGSAKTDTGWSLNDIQYVGPPIQNNILAILLRFRMYQFVVCADIAKMYRQIMVDKNDQALQQIVWRSDPQSKLKHYTLQTVTYGTSSAPFLAIRCLRALALEYKEQFPTAANIILRDTYVDDLITGFHSEEEAIETCKIITFILSRGCFPLRKWKSNSKSFLDSLDDGEVNNVLKFNDDKAKTLGISWSCKSDNLSFCFEISGWAKLTKRRLLSEIAKLFDPLGLISPCIISMKILIQKLWASNLNWDDEVPGNIKTIWEKFYNQLSCLNKLKIPRYVSSKEQINSELHIFCDASQDAYAASIYVRSLSSTNNIHVALLCAKSRVSPLKKLSVPRLELCAALLGAELAQFCLASLNLNTVDCYFWSDSQVVLQWLHSNDKVLPIFVANRVNKIRKETSQYRWGYVNTKQNPADIASRGITPSKLLECSLWWGGPGFLYEKELPEPSEKLCSKACDVYKIEVKNEFSTELFSRYSSLIKLKRIVALCLRFITNLKTKQNDLKKFPTELSVDELNKSMQILIRLSQNDSYSNEISLLKTNARLTKGDSNLLSLSPFLDESGILRVGGRLNNAHINYDSKHPILLNGKHILSKLIISFEHKRLLHASTALLLSNIRQTYWITSGMSTVKGVIKKCLTCFRTKPKPLETIMANIPENRLKITTPFNITGVDYAGPYLLKDRKGRGFKEFKTYLAIFVCFSCKAMHIELVTDLTTEAFIAALRRFASRRGKPEHIFSDNATNFVGSNKEIQNLYKFLKDSENDIFKLCANENITWSFIPPNSPHHGGLWEAAVKSVKTHLQKIIGNTHLLFEEFQTIIVQIEAVLNSRPLYAMSTDPNDLEPLTPSHFVLGRAVTLVPDPDVTHLPMGKLSRFQFLQHIQQIFWKRWSIEYFSSLQQRNKWKSVTSNLKEDMLVLIKQENLPPGKWLLGRVVQVHPGNDGIVRVASVNTANGILKRAITKLCPLPMDNN